MLKELRLENVGPAPELSIAFRKRLNFLAGDNGLGKSFVLDIAWWALTRTWARLPAVPHAAPAEARISYCYDSKTSEPRHTSEFDRASEVWSSKPGRPPMPGLVIYTQVDGGFSVWDPARNYWKKDSPSRPASYLFSAEEVWQGNDLCEGIIRDWASWQRENAQTFARLKEVLLALSPSESEPLFPGSLRKISLDDPKRYPTLKTAYDQEVALIHASAGIRRVVALAYILVWAWQEHIDACALRGEPPSKEVIFLVDEVEAHLHPQWQRRVVPALLGVMEAMTGADDVETQLIVATHSALVLASVEPFFDPDRDGLFLLELKQGRVSLREEPWAKQRAPDPGIDARELVR